MMGMSPEQEALYALHWNVPRSELSMTAQLEYDRLRPAWERGEVRLASEELEAARRAWEREHTAEAKALTRFTDAEKTNPRLDRSIPWIVIAFGIICLILGGLFAAAKNSGHNVVATVTHQGPCSSSADTCTVNVVYNANGSQVSAVMQGVPSSDLYGPPSHRLLNINYDSGDEANPTTNDMPDAVWIGFLAGGAAILGIGIWMRLWQSAYKRERAAAPARWASASTAAPAAVTPPAPNQPHPSGPARLAERDARGTVFASTAEHPPKARDQRGSWAAPSPGRYARPMTGDQVRGTIFLTVGGGYDKAEVDDLLRSVAAELDSGRPVEQLIAKATFRTRKNGYDADAVDWFIEQFLLRPGFFELAARSADPWRDLGVVAQFTRSEVGDLAEGSAEPSRLALREYFAEDCRKAWHDFDQQPGVHLRWAGAGIARRELHTMEAQTIASRRDGWSTTITAGGRSFTLKRTGVLVDETGIPVLYTSGKNFNHRARASISFPDQRWLRFLVRGTSRADSVMTAVDEAGNKVARYRIIDQGFTLRRNDVEITVHPDWQLTEELMLAITISAPWLHSYFGQPGGGG